MPSQTEHSMDRMYKVQRHFYDLTRKYFLLGRDTALQRMAVRPGERVLEIGCGTARNLIKLLRLQPEGRYFGLDASREMLKTAGTRLARVPGGSQVRLQVCLAERLDYRQVFGLQQPFDVMLFSYALSMIPTWQEALAAARANLAPQGRLIIVDFWDQRELPGWFARLLKRWLNFFGVHYRPELTDFLRNWGDTGHAAVAFEKIGGRYAFVASVSGLPAPAPQALASPRPLKT
jgi:S-adenosylmethionine-diacylgycerolhomoserine-N-methlytransferase